MSVPERRGAYRSALVAGLRETGVHHNKLGAPLLRPHDPLHGDGWFEAGFAPITRMTSAFFRSIQ